jgi:phospholipid/cholesterol/gamma-HCH transport system substrate-binding protein
MQEGQEAEQGRQVRQEEEEGEGLMAGEPKNYDERIYRKGPQGISHFKLGLILLALLIAGSYLAVTKELPFTSHYEVKAVFTNAANIRSGSPVRIAGVNVGKVTGVRSVGNDAEVTFTVDDEGRPVREDSTARIRPRIFLEGNFFIDLKPGTPSSPEIKDNGTIPVTQTSTAVQLDEILTSLQAPSRENLKLLLEGYGTGLNHVPTAAEDVGQDPSVKGKSGAAAINSAFQTGGDAGRDTAITNEALLGTQAHDLSGLIAASNTTFEALISRETQLKDLITNFNTTAGAFAAQSTDLNNSIRELGPTVADAGPALLKLNATFPPLRAFARDIRPGIAELPATIAAANPWVAQVKPLLGASELGGVAKQLKLASPPLAAATHSSLTLFPQLQATSQCFSGVLLPTGNVQINDLFPTNGPNYREFFYAATGLAGESQNFDGNGPYVRFQSGGGPVLTHAAQPGGGFENDQIYGNAIAAPLASQPALGGLPQYRTDVPCSANDIPDLNGPAAAPGPPSPAP